MSEIDAIKKDVDTYKMFLKIREQQAKKDKYKNYSQDGLIDEILEQQEEIERLHNIIKEVRKLREQLSYQYYENGFEYDTPMLLKDLDKILDKEGK